MHFQFHSDSIYNARLAHFFCGDLCNKLHTKGRQLSLPGRTKSNLCEWPSDFRISLKVRASACSAPEIVMSFGIYAIGYFILILGLAYLAHLMHVPQAYIIAMAIIMFGIGVVTGVQRTRGKDPN